MHTGQVSYVHFTMDTAHIHSIAVALGKCSIFFLSTKGGARGQGETADLPPITEKPFTTNTQFLANLPSPNARPSVRRLLTVKGQIAPCDVEHLLHNFYQIRSPGPCEKLCANVIESRLVPPLKTVTE